MRDPVFKYNMGARRGVSVVESTHCSCRGLQLHGDPPRSHTGTKCACCTARIRKQLQPSVYSSTPHTSPNHQVQMGSEGPQKMAITVEMPEHTVPWKNRVGALTITSVPSLAQASTPSPILSRLPGHSPAPEDSHLGKL